MLRSGGFRDSAARGPVIVCFGDSNTYGFDPRSFFGSRYPADSRWPEVLAALSGLEVRVDGMNGRRIPRPGQYYRGSFDRMILMLGTNDLLQGDSAAEAAARMEAYLRSLSVPPERLMLVAPAMGAGEWVTPELLRQSAELARHYQALARELSMPFGDAGAWQIPLCFDGIHFTEAGHRRFAEKIWEQINKEALL